jgi:hypothetical protein
MQRNQRNQRSVAMMGLMVIIAVDVAVMAASPSIMPTKDPTSAETYYDSIDFAATDDVLKGQLHDLINPHTVWSYDDVWGAFSSVDVYLPTYPCDAANLTHIPDVYSGFCWDPEKIATTGGECGNYKVEVRSTQKRFNVRYSISIPFSIHSHSHSLLFAIPFHSIPLPIHTITISFYIPGRLLQSRAPVAQELVGHSPSNHLII